ncbi:UNVERIFIED_CONTAM: DUF4283 domain-containing protein, partial [Salmonella enterica subsp. enterica serovar Weltevreden]
GRMVSFRILQQKLTEMWTVGRGLKIIDLESGYYAVRFYCRTDYDTALEQGPWMIQGHYLTVTKWRPDFHQEKKLLLLLHG